jgi:hypothetical protein
MTPLQILHPQPRGIAPPSQLHAVPRPSHALLSRGRVDNETEAIPPVTALLLEISLYLNSRGGARKDLYGCAICPSAWPWRVGRAAAMEARRINNIRESKPTIQLYTLMPNSIR